MPVPDFDVADWFDGTDGVDLADCTVLAVSEEIDLSNADLVEAELSRRLRACITATVIVDVRATLLTVTGVAVLESLHALAGRQGVRLLVVPRYPLVRRVLRLTGADRVLSVHPGRESGPGSSLSSGSGPGPSSGSSSGAGSGPSSGPSSGPGSGPSSGPRPDPGSGSRPDPGSGPRPGPQPGPHPVQGPKLRRPRAAG
ncbi:STAS domain-containing protein [Streptomyces sp. ODS28]|uniref:STAS domain-containing protein n=1 Tax=Streptomyces sp. ODS28 TaxID=3136688 RepID=UPI0031E58190